MKHIIFVAGLCLTLTQPVSAEEPKKETVRVCVDVKDKQGQDVVDPKTKKVKQNCKEVKQHKKLDGTKVPDKK
jgi:hypothetical protein